MKNKSDTNAVQKEEPIGNQSPTNNYMEELSMDDLAKKALDETIRDGGAFASENSNQFKQ